MLNLLCKGDWVVVRSRRRLLVRSGNTAGIDVGDEVPVVPRVSDREQQVGGTTNVLPEVSYRKTGVQIEIKPLVQANGLVDSEYLPAATLLRQPPLPLSPVGFLESHPPDLL